MCNMCNSSNCTCDSSKHKEKHGKSAGHERNEGSTWQREERREEGHRKEGSERREEKSYDGYKK